MQLSSASNISFDAYRIHIVTHISDYRRGFDWGIDLLTTYKSQLQIITTLLLISTLQITQH
jgi:hypothetical protein